MTVVDGAIQVIVRGNPNQAFLQFCNQSPGRERLRYGYIAIQDEENLTGISFVVGSTMAGMIRPIVGKNAVERARELAESQGWQIVTNFSGGDIRGRR